MCVGVCMCGRVGGCTCEVTKLIEVIFYGLCPSVCDPMHCVNCVDSGVCLVVSQARPVLSWLLFLFCVNRLLASYCTTHVMLKH